MKRDKMREEQEKETISHLRKVMKKIQKKKRFEHTLGVEYTAAALAMRYEASIRDARLAGLLHDCTKCFSDDKQLEICKKHHITLTEVECRNPFLLHAKTGAWMAREKYGIRNPDIINAIRYHTTGRPDMSLLEKIIFVSDYIEPNRKMTPVVSLEAIRRQAFVDLDSAVEWILKSTLDYLRASGREIDAATEVTYSFYCE